MTYNKDLKLTPHKFNIKYKLINWLNELELAEARNYVDFFFSLNKNILILDKSNLKEFNLDEHNKTLFQALNVKTPETINLNLNYKQLNSFDSIDYIYKTHENKITKIDLYYLNFWLIGLNTSDEIYQNLIKKIEDQHIRFELTQNDLFL